MIIKLSGATFTKYIGTVDASGTVTKKKVTLTITTTPAGATVKINGTVRNSIEVDYGTSVTYEVSMDGYVTKSGSIVVMSTGNTMTQNITLRAVGSTEPEEPGTGGGNTGGDNISWFINGYQSDGSLNNLTTRARVFVKVDDINNATIVGNSNVKYCLYAFESNFQSTYIGKISNFINGVTTSNMIEELGKIVTDTSRIKYIGVTGAFQNDTEITDIDAFSNNFTFTGVSNATMIPKNFFQSGGITTVDGALVSNGNRARTLPLTIENVTVTNNTGYKHIIYLYSGEAADETCYVSKLNDWTDSTQISLASIPSTTTHYRIVVKNDDNTNISINQAYENTTISK